MSATRNGAEIRPVPAIEPGPNWEDVRQVQEPPMRSVPVEVQGNVRASVLPGKRGVGHTYILQPNISNQPTSIIPGDPRIKHVIVVNSTTGQNAIIGKREQLTQPNGADGLVIVPGVPYPPLSGLEEEVFGIAAGGTAVTLSVWIEYWAD